jgi:hypothetical protein
MLVAAAAVLSLRVAGHDRAISGNRRYISAMIMSAAAINHSISPGTRGCELRNLQWLGQPAAPPVFHDILPALQHN